MIRTQTLWRIGRIETVLIYVVAAVFLVATVVILGHEAKRHINDFERWIVGLGPWALIVFVLLYALLSSAFVPDTALGIIAGATFGFGQGIAVAVSGSLLGAMFQYAMSRRLLKPVIDRALASKPALAATQAAVLEQQLRLQLLIRLTPLNRALTSYVLSAAGVGFTRFLAACVGLLPSLCLEVYFGYAGKHLAKAASEPHHTVILHDIVLVAGLVVAITVMVLVSRTARRAVEAATEVIPAQ